MNENQHELGEHSAKIEQHDRLFSVLFEKLEIMDGKMDAQAVALVQMSAKITPCPNPGACIALSERLEQTNKEVSRLKMWKHGIVAASAVTWVGICGMAIVFYDWCKEHITTKISSTADHIHAIIAAWKN